MGSKKRRRSESFQAEHTGDDDARKRLAAFHERMFDLPQEKAVEIASEMPRVVFKSKQKKRKHRSGDADDEEPMPVIKFNKTKVKKEKKKKMKSISAAPVKLAAPVKVAGQAVVKVPGKRSDTKNKPKKMKVVKNVEVKIEKKKTNQAPQWHSMTKEDDANDDVDLLEQALGSMKKMAAKQTVKQLHKKTKTTSKTVAVQKEEKPNQKEGSAEEKKHVLTNAVEIDVGGSVEHLSNGQKKRKKNRLKALKAQEKNSGNLAHDNSPAKQTGNQNEAAPSPKSPKSCKKQKKSPKVKCVLPNPHTSAQHRQGKPLTVPDEPNPESTKLSKDTISVAPKTTKDSAVTKGKKATQPTQKVVSNEDKATKLLTPIAASLVKDAKKTNDMFLSASETSLKPEVSTGLRKVAVASKRAEKEKSPAAIQVPDVSSSSESEDDGGFDFGFGGGDDSSLFSRLIDSAARERWELIEVGRLVRLFSAEWNFKENKTAQFLEDTCPELVSVDFLEGLGVNLSAKQLIRVFEAGSGNSEVLVNKMASAVENGHLSVHDSDFVSALERRVALMESNGEVVEFLHPLLESLSTVRDVGCLLKKLCEHWQLERKLSLVQQVLLSNVFDDLDGNQDEILVDLPDLTGRLDFPSRLDQEDVDENGNLKGFLANDDSEYSGEEGSEEDDEEEEIDSEVDENPYEGESDSDEEVEITGRSRGRNQFIEDEVEVGEEDEEEEEEELPHSDAETSSSDSD
ncbi:hypothetical protein P3T76_000471 [Phytophthora citrophthora]|uniref:Uncharacterized protein n=1 Tax=Phytophthora citrophthora TaxID=4793 RepID=A0AAD9H236_9STRA|nr:hypothetical protein P3T76_000471 [Phytophthora citrophthora]